MSDILSFEDAIALADVLSGKECAGRKRLLLGNGFSMACHGEFKYTALYAEVKRLGLSSQIQGIFEQFGETNFEAILKLLDQSAWMAAHYKMSPADPSLDMTADYQLLKDHLAEAICSVHPSHSALIPDHKYESCYQFISCFDDVFTINYDLLLYWTSLRHEPFRFRDGFSKDQDTDGNDCEYMPEHMDNLPAIYFLHGALHLYHDGASVRKRVWRETGIHLIDQIRQALQDKLYPLVVAEGDSFHKELQIQESSYLFNVFRKFKGIQGHLFIFGSSLSVSDNHIVDAIANNLELRHLWIGIRGDLEDAKNVNFLRIESEMIRKRNIALSRVRRLKKYQGNLTVHYYNSDSAHVWDNASE